MRQDFLLDLMMEAMAAPLRMQTGAVQPLVESHGPEIVDFVYGSFEDSLTSQLPPGQKISSQRL